LKVDDVFVVCDAGGGTVDLISCTITSINPLKVVETTVGTGGICGAQNLNVNFEEHVKKRIGDAKLQKYKTEKAKSWRIALDIFEDRVKRWFGSVSMTEFEVPLPGMDDDVDAGIEESCLILTTNQMKEIFDPVVDDVITLIEGQVARVRDQGGNVKAILCVGGFGQSGYLFTRLKNHYETDLPPPYTPSRLVGRAHATITDVERPSIQIMQPTNSWTSVLRGAIELGLANDVVVARRSRYHYGVQAGVVFIDGVHPPESKYWDTWLEQWCARGVMQWYINKGEAVSAELTVRMNFSRSYRRNPFTYHEFGSPSRLYYCASDIQPLMFDASVVHKLCTLTADLSELHESQFLTKRIDGEMHYKLQYELVMTINSADIDFEFDVDGNIYGSVSASFDH